VKERFRSLSSLRRPGCVLPMLPWLALLQGCGRSPVFNVLGSYFPGWIACILLGAAFAAGLHSVLKRMRWEERIQALPLFYLCVAMAIACMFWLIAFE
jgi:hypothetical protein